MGLKEFSLVYQPQVDTKTRVVTGFEALIRWNSAELGVVSPVDFIPVAEKTGEIKSIGTWVINEACREAMTWPEHLTVAVNVSPLQFDGHSFISIVERALAKSGLHPNRLEIEITEGLLIDRPEEALSLLSSIRDMGVKVAMDDFGTGYSSLSYLKSFPFTKLKIDQIFVRGEQSSKSQALVEAILTLGKRLGMTTIAEGVETEEQYRHLADSGCAGAQGYLISKPIAAEAVGQFIEDHDPQWREGEQDD